MCVAVDIVASWWVDRMGYWACLGLESGNLGFWNGDLGFGIGIWVGGCTRSNDITSFISSKKCLNSILVLMRERKLGILR